MAKRVYRKRRKLSHIIGIKVFNILFRSSKVEENKVFFLNFSNLYDCNPKYICEQFLKDGKSLKLVFATNKSTNVEGTFPSEVKIVRKGTKDFYKELYSSKVIFDNDITLAFLGFRKKQEQVVFQTFHGSLGIKAFGRDANNDTYWHRMADKSAKMTDFIISNSEFENNIYKSTFWANTKIFKFGHARNDVFYRKSKEISEIKANIFEKYHIELDHKLCLYAPTFRDRDTLYKNGLNFEKLAASLIKKFGGKWTILIRLHSVAKSQNSITELPPNVIDVSDYPDIQELSAIIDCGITDYSSWICEYLLRKQPGFIYAYDKDEYQNNERPFTVRLEDLPFPLSTNMDELIRSIDGFDQNEFEKRCTEFLKKQGSVDDGQASERIVKEAMKYLKP